MLCCWNHKGFQVSSLWFKRNSFTAYSSFFICWIMEGIEQVINHFIKVLFLTPNSWLKDFKYNSSVTKLDVLSWWLEMLSVKMPHNLFLNLSVFQNAQVIYFNSSVYSKSPWKIDLSVPLPVVDWCYHSLSNTRKVTCFFFQLIATHYASFTAFIISAWIML